MQTLLSEAQTPNGTSGNLPWTAAPKFKGIACFGASGSRGGGDQELLTYWNHERAQILAHLVATNQVIRCVTFRTRRGRLEHFRFKNPYFVLTLTHQYTYPADRRATLQEFRNLLDSNGELARAAEIDGITLEALEYEIDQTFEKGDFDA